MGALVGGIIALILGLIGLIYWWGYFLDLLRAAIPAILLLGGALATYLGVEEWKETGGRAEAEAPAEDFPSELDRYKSEAESYKAEAERYKAELEALKKSQGEEAPEESPEE